MAINKKRENYRIHLYALNEGHYPIILDWMQRHRDVSLAALTPKDIVELSLNSTSFH